MASSWCCCSGTVVAMLWALQRRLIYFPDPTPVPLPGTSSPVPATSRSTRPTASSWAPGSSRRPAQWTPGWRSWSRRATAATGSRAEFAEELSRRGLAVLLMDYRGYGGNPGSPSQDGLAADADAAAGAMEELGYPPQRTIYFGESWAQPW